MPAYDFKCNVCDNRFTVRVPMKERQNVKCTQCDSGQLTQLFTGVNVLGAGGNDCEAPANSFFT